MRNFIDCDICVDHDSLPPYRRPSIRIFRTNTQIFLKPEFKPANALKTRNKYVFCPAHRRLIYFKVWEKLHYTTVHTVLFLMIDHGRKHFFSFSTVMFRHTKLDRFPSALKIQIQKSTIFCVKRFVQAMVVQCTILYYFVCIFVI